MDLESLYNDSEEELTKILSRLPLGEEKFIGIYGVGVHTKRLLHGYQRCVGSIKARIIFIDSNKQTMAEKYNDCDVYNVHDIGKLPLDAIIISSFLYENEMYQMIQRLYGDRFCVYRLYEDSENDIFETAWMCLEERKEFRKALKIQFVDFWPGFDIVHNFIVEILFPKYKIQISDEPDVLFCSHFGDLQKKYANCKKVFVITEVRPFECSEYDYVIGYPYSKAKNFFHYNLYTPKNISSIQDRSRFSDVSFAQRKFCNFVYSNETWGGGAGLRKQFCIELSRYKQIDCPGNVLNNMKNTITPRQDAKWQDSKKAFLEQYKFTIAFENHRVDGYTTEKLYDPLSVGSIPIYWGNPLIGKEIDSEAFINCNDFDNDFEAVIKRVKEVDADDELYMYMLQKSPFRETCDSGFEKLGSFLDNIIDSYKDWLGFK